MKFLRDFNLISGTVKITASPNNISDIQLTELLDIIRESKVAKHSEAEIRQILKTYQQGLDYAVLIQLIKTDTSVPEILKAAATYTVEFKKAVDLGFTQEILKFRTC